MKSRVIPQLELCRVRLGVALAALILAVGAGTLFAAPFTGHLDFLIQTWLNGDGIPDNSALAVAQTRDGYLWVGTGDGLLRFDGVEFTKAAQSTNLHLLKEIVQCLSTDRSGRLWVSTLSGMLVYENSVWHKIEGTNVLMRSLVEDAKGRVWVGGPEGNLYSVKDYKIEQEPAPEGLTPSGVFCLQDAEDGGVWLANRGFVGRLTDHGWQRFGLETPIRAALLAAAARGGGIWTFSGTELKHYHASG